MTLRNAIKSCLDGARKAAFSPEVVDDDDDDDDVEDDDVLLLLSLCLFCTIS